LRRGVWLLTVWATLGSVACGPVMYSVGVAGAVQAVEEARQAGAELAGPVRVLLRPRTPRKGTRICQRGGVSERPRHGRRSRGVARNQARDIARRRAAVRAGASGMGRTHEARRWGLALAVDAARLRVGCQAVAGAHLGDCATCSSRPTATARTCAPPASSPSAAPTPISPSRELDEAHMSPRRGAPPSRRRTPGRRCGSRPPSAARRAVVVVQRPATATATGYLDPDDQCPDQPENFNGYQDSRRLPRRPGHRRRRHPRLARRVPHRPRGPRQLPRRGRLPGAGQRRRRRARHGGQLPQRARGPGHDYNDQDGCPDPDNDQDTVADLVTDQCPNEAGPVDNQGCPPVFTAPPGDPARGALPGGVRLRPRDAAPSAAVTLDEVVQLPPAAAEPRRCATRSAATRRARAACGTTSDLSAPPRAHRAQLPGERTASRPSGSRPGATAREQPLESNRTSRGSAGATVGSSSTRSTPRARPLVPPRGVLRRAQTASPPCMRSPTPLRRIPCLRIGRP
jgi:hypothetical protein